MSPEVWRLLDALMSENPRYLIVLLVASRTCR